MSEQWQTRADSGDHDSRNGGYAKDSRIRRPGHEQDQDASATKQGERNVGRWVVCMAVPRSSVSPVAGGTTGDDGERLVSEWWWDWDAGTGSGRRITESGDMQRPNAKG